MAGLDRLLVQPHVLDAGVDRRVVVIGAGVAGTAVAAELASTGQVAVSVLERGPADRLVGSTGHAPGFIGVLGEAPVLTELARLSTDIYEQLHHDGEVGFERVGGLEVACSQDGWARLQRRAAAAEAAGLPAQLLTAQEAVQHAPDLIDEASCVGGALFPADGTARAQVITAALHEQARTAGVRFHHDATVTAITTTTGSGPAWTVSTSQQDHLANDVVLACGIWGQQVAALAGVRVPLVPVAHPYVHGPVRASTGRRSPFVRWPQQHVYARDHGDRWGLGSYAHAPVPVGVEDFGSGAELPWRADFDEAIAHAMALLPRPQRFKVASRLNGVFSMTADNLPLLGPVEQAPGLWVGQALWVTHAAGAARSLAQTMTGQPPAVTGLKALRPDRFDARPQHELTLEALRLYNDIYATA